MIGLHAMAVPPYVQFIEPILRYLVEHPDGAPVSGIYEATAEALGLSEEDKREFIPSGGQATYKNRCGWAHDRLKRNGYSSSPKRGFWRLTPEGIEFAQTHPRPLTATQVDRIAGANLTVTLKQPTRVDHSEVPPSAIQVVQDATSTPDELFQSALYEIRSTVASELLETLVNVSPQFFERVVLDVLHEMGYGATREDLRQVGGSGDGGVDGVINLDKLGLEKVYVQAKRWKGTVGRPEIQGFYGALAGNKARKGVFITTSVFTPGALEYARAIEGVVLVDGNKLAELMMNHGVGVSLRTVHLPRLDSDYFEGA